MSEGNESGARAHGVSFDGARFRQVLGHFSAGVTVVTAMDGDVPVGLAVSAFTSVSLDPPKVLFCAGRGSTSWPRIEAAGAFCVNILADDQEDVCRVFAARGTDRFAEIGWKHSGNRSPVITGALAYVDCTIDVVVESGDHYVVIGDVTGLDVMHEGGPLIFYRGGYGSFTT